MHIKPNNLFSQPATFTAFLEQNDNFSSLSMSSLLAKGNIPFSHRRIADNYMIIKKIYGFNSLQNRISLAEKSLLAKYDFNPLEYSTIKQINEEIQYLQKWSYSLDDLLRTEADKILEIRLKELKFLITNKYVTKTNEIYSGYLSLERYFEMISKY